MNADDPRNNCKMQERCECLAPYASPARATLRMFCDHWQEPEKQIAELHRQSILNWKRLPDQVRVPCLDALRQYVPKSTLRGWRDQKARGVVIGSNRVRFHFDEGMIVRNALRKVHRDDFLPLGNWDDYYYGAIDELAGEFAARVTVHAAPNDACEFCGVSPNTIHMSDCPKLREYPTVFVGLPLPKVTCPACFGARYIGDNQCPICMGAGDIVDVNYQQPGGHGPRPYHVGRVKLPPYIPAKEFPETVAVVSPGAECHHHRLTLECSICKRLAVAAQRAVPPGVYYNRQNDNFYTFAGNGMGDAFYNSWRARRDEFPIRPDAWAVAESDCKPTAESDCE